MVGETNSVVGYHLLTKGHSIQLGSGEGVCYAPPPTPTPHQVQGSVLIITIILIIIFLLFPMKSQSNLSLKFLNKKEHVYQTYDMKHLNAAGK